MAYSELIKRFERTRSYMRAFYVYGLKHRGDFGSPRSYDDERRRVESWLGDHARSSRTAEGKTVFVSVDNRSASRNPLFQAWKAKSFTDGDITLHFLLFDILHSPEVALTLKQILAQIDSRLQGFAEPMTFDESTVRKKLAEYIAEGLVEQHRAGRQSLYCRAADTDVAQLQQGLHFFSETAPCGVIGSFLLDRLEPEQDALAFKHHYTTQTMDSEVLEAAFRAMHRKSTITVTNVGRKSGEPHHLELVPLRVRVGVQNGRQHLICYDPEGKRFASYRLDHLSHVRPGAPFGEFDRLREQLKRTEAHMWAVNCRKNGGRLERVSFEIRAGLEEPYIVQRLQREKRCGTVTRLDNSHYRFTAEVFDTRELLPWIRTFIGRITRLDFSNRTVENELRQSIGKMYAMYEMNGGAGL